MRRILPVACLCLLSTGLLACGDDDGQTNNNQNNVNQNGNVNQNNDNGNANQNAGCGNAAVDTGEVCDGTALAGQDCVSIDQGFTGGALACNATCDGWVTSGCTSGTCGDAIIDTELGEVCDATAVGTTTCETLGLGRGPVYCQPDCQGFQTQFCTETPGSCGDGIVQWLWEVCDPGAGDTPCAEWGLAGGSITCTTDCQLDFSQCTGDVCENEGAYGDGYCYPCERWGGHFDPDCDSCRVADGHCVSFRIEGGGTTCLQATGVEDPDCGLCGNGTVESVELCDGTAFDYSTCRNFGFATGTLACTEDCGVDTTGCLPAVCGNDILEGFEACDGADLGWYSCRDLGFAGGLLACNDDCTRDTTGCVPTVCGDHVAEGQESCDGTDLSGYTCASWGYQGGTLACDADCDYDLSGCEAGTCGDGVASGQERCDGADLRGYLCEYLGFGGGTLGCRADCTFDTSECTVSVCGDGVRDANESCDGDDLQGQGCRSFGYDGGELACSTFCDYDFRGCTPVSVCGNGVREINEDCDGVVSTSSCSNYGHGTGQVTCRPDCTISFAQCVVGICGDGQLDSSTEECDGDVPGWQSCENQGYAGGSPSCTEHCSIDFSRCIPAVCGNDVAEGNNESCDGTDLRGSSCENHWGFVGGTLACNAWCGWDTSQCIPHVCGNDVAESGESCDGSDLLGYACTSWWGYVGGTLACDGSCNWDFSGCEEPVCGDGLVESGESCDGTNLAGYTCANLGRGFNQGELACDDACNDFDTSGCSFACQAIDLGTFAGSALWAEGNTCSGGSYDSYGCFGYSWYNYDLIYQVEVPAGTSVDVSYQPFDGQDVLLYALLDCANVGANGCIASADAGAGDYTETITLTNSGATSQIYFIVTDSYSGCGNGRVTVFQP